MHFPHPKLNFPPINLRIKESGSSLQVWNPLRCSYIVLTPEEWVRRHVVDYLISGLSVPQLQIVEEYPVGLNSQRQRADVVVISRCGVPLLMVECKAYDVKLSQSTLDQAVRYNSVLSADYIMLTNGLTHHLYERVDDNGGYKVMNNFSELSTGLLTKL